MAEGMTRTWVLRNKRYYIVFPKCSKEAAKLFAIMAKQRHGDKLEYAQLSERLVDKPNYLTAGTLCKRGVV